MAVIKPSFIIKGALTYVLPQSAFSRKSGGSNSARYCYSVFMRHLVSLNRISGFTVPKTVAELGPGDSLGIGLCALLSGAERYVGLDLVPFTDLSRNLPIFDELVSLFLNRAPIPDDDEFPRVRPKLTDYRFPSDIIDTAVMTRALTPERINILREHLQSGGGEMINYVAPWLSEDQIKSSCIDWIFSQAVLEHVTELEESYQAFSTWIKPGGIMSHQIDFKCHNLSTSWNGHWATPDWLWRIARGRRPYLLNREPLSKHEALLDHNGFVTLYTDRAVRDDGLMPEQLLARYRDLSTEDVSTAGAFIISQKHDSSVSEKRPE